MSVTVFGNYGLWVTRFVGPADEGEDRQRWEFIPWEKGRAVLTREQVDELIAALVEDTTRHG